MRFTAALYKTRPHPANSTRSSARLRSPGLTFPPHRCSAAPARLQRLDASMRLPFVSLFHAHATTRSGVGHRHQSPAGRRNGSAFRSREGVGSPAANVNAPRTSPRRRINSRCSASVHQIARPGRTRRRQLRVELHTVHDATSSSAGTHSPHRLPGQSIPVVSANDPAHASSVRPGYPSRTATHNRPALLRFSTAALTLICLHSTLTGS